MSEAKKAFSAQAALQLEAARHSLRQSQNFTYEGLLELHAKTFRNIPGETDQEISDYFIQYGPVREKSERALRYKIRPVHDTSYLSVYSNMELSDVARVRTALGHYQPEQMQNLAFNEKVKRLAELYRQIDYLHPFSDGNSRVTRVFVA